MATKTAERYHYRVAQSAPLRRTADGGAVVTGKRVFRVGQFRDSRGRQVEVSPDDLAAMVANFYALKATHLPNVPIRRDHSETVTNVMGYYTDLSTDGTYLYADFEITEPEDIAKYERGTYRSVSIEIGSYTTNDGQKYEPVVLGLAFVDLPAVEGLFTLHQEDIDTMSEITQEDLDAAVAYALACGYAQALADAEPSDEQVQFALACGYAQADVDVRAEFAANDTERPPFKFTLAGGDITTDYSAVQAELAELKIARVAQAEQKQLFRSAFVDDLVRDNKIPAPMATQLKALAATLTDEQYAAFAATYEQAPALSMFANHGDSGGGSTGATVGATPGANSTAVEIAHLEKVVAFQREGGISDASLEQLPSYKRLIQLRQAQEV